MKFSEHIDSFQIEDPNFLTYRCERYRVGTDRPAIYVLKLKSSPNAHSTGNIAGFEVHKQLPDNSLELVNALNFARRPLLNALGRRKREARKQVHELRVQSGFYSSDEYRDWSRRSRAH